MGIGSVEGKHLAGGAGVWEVGLGVGGWVGLGVGGFIGGQGRKKSSKFRFRVRWAPLNYGAS